MTEPMRPDSPAEPLLAASQVEDVFVATEEVRAAGFPHVPADLLVGVLAAERDNPEDRSAAQRAVGRAIDAYLAETALDGLNGKDRT